MCIYTYTSTKYIGAGMSPYVCSLACVPTRLCGFVYVVCCYVCVFGCIMCLVKAYTSQVFTDFNDWTLGTTGVCVPRDLLLLTEEVKGMKLTFAFHPDSR